MIICGYKDLEGAAVSFHLGACVFELSLANIYERWSCLRVVSKSFPLRAPRSDRSPELRAGSFRNFGGNAVLIGGDKCIALGDTNLSSCAGVAVSVVVPVRGWTSRRRGIGVSRVGVSVRIFRPATGEH